MDTHGVDLGELQNHSNGNATLAPTSVFNRAVLLLQIEGVVLAVRRVDFLGNFVEKPIHVARF